MTFAVQLGLCHLSFLFLQSVKKQFVNVDNYILLCKTKYFYDIQFKLFYILCSIATR